MIARVVRRSLAGATSARETLALCVAAGVLRIVLVLAFGSEVPPAADGAFYHVVAQRIAAGEGYTWLWPDGVVTYAAHYPVGYAGLVGGAYALFGPSPLVAMVLNALFGVVAVLATHRLALRLAGPRGALLAGGLVAVSPTLVGYTLALMTEGAVATLWVLSLWLAVRAGEAARSPGKRQLLEAGGAALALGLGVLLRPQSLLLAPAIGWIAAAGASTWVRRGGQALLLTALALSVCLPWTARNCLRMDRCVLVSANGGWNLLIGTLPEGEGAYVPVVGERVPEECRDVFGEAAKDQCFGAAGRRRIADDPGRWLSLVPAKWRSTFDFTASASAYLAEAGASLSGDARDLLSALEVAARRLLVALALVGALRLGPKHRLRLLAAALGVLFLLAKTAWISHLLLLGLLVTAGGVGRRPLLLGAIAALGATLFVHAAFFGAGRYSMVLEPFLAILAAGALGVRRPEGVPLLHGAAERHGDPQPQSVQRSHGALDQHGAAHQREPHTSGA